MQERVQTDVAADGLVLETRVDGSIAVLSLNRPQARNAMSLAVLGELHTAVERLGRDGKIAAIVLAGNGPAFCSGHDLKEMTDHRADADGGRAFFEKTMRACSAMMQAIVACPQPVIAAVHGIATAAGCQLVASCDLAVAAETATFATPGVNIGLFCSTPMVALSRNISRKQTMEMLLLGEMISAPEAWRWGLVNRVVPQGQVIDAALAMARTIAAKSKTVVALGKPAFYAQLEMPLDKAYDYTARIMVENMMQLDAEEGICAFLDKRPPEWKDG